MWRSANAHRGSKVTAITSRGKFLISADETGKIIVFDSSKQQEICSPDCSKIGITNPRSLHLMENDNTIVIGTDTGFYSVNISDSALVAPKTPSGPVTSMVKIKIRDQKNLAAFIATHGNG